MSNITITMPESTYERMKKEIADAKEFKNKIIGCIDYSSFKENVNIPVLIKKELITVLRPLIESQVVETDFSIRWEE